MELPDAYYVLSFDDGDFEYLSEEDGERVNEAIKNHEKFVEVNLIAGSPMMAMIAHIVTNVRTTFETRTEAREFIFLLRAEAKEFDEEHKSYDE